MQLFLKNWALKERRTNFIQVLMVQNFHLISLYSNVVAHMLFLKQNLILGR
jgi:hypothetical protein